MPQVHLTEGLFCSEPNLTIPPPRIRSAPPFTQGRQKTRAQFLKMFYIR